MVDCAGEGRSAQAAASGHDSRRGRALRAFVAAALGVKETSPLAGRRGVAEVAFARQVTMYLAHTHLGMPMTASGMLVARDRATARHACRKIEDLRDDPHIDELLVCLERGLDVAIRIAGFRGERV